MSLPLAAPAFTASGRSELSGRSRELEDLGAAVQAVAGGEGRILLLEGEAGIGKTSLLSKALELAEARGLQVFMTRAEELDSRRPFGAVADCLDITPESYTGRRGEIASLLFGEVPPAYGLSLTAEGAGAEFRVAEHIVSLVKDLAIHQPLALSIDDLQWCDPSTCLVLHRLGRDLARVPVLVLCACRLSPRTAELRQLVESFGRRGMAHIRPGPLSEQAVATLAATHLGAPPSVALLGQLAAAGGNPLFVTELLAAFEEGMLQRNGAGEAEICGGEFSSFRAVVLRRLTALPKATVALLRFAAVLGSSFSAGDLSNFLGRPSVALEEPLRESVEFGVLLERQDVLAFRHELIREALYNDLPDPLRIALHREAAGALACTGTALIRVAEHLMRGSSPGDRKAVEWLRKAAHEAAPRAPGTAVELLAKAVQLAGADAALAGPLIADHAMALAWAGRFDDAEEICRQALARPQDPISELTFRMCLVQTLLGSGRAAEALQETQSAVMSSSLDAADRVRFRAWESTCRLSTGDLTRAVEVAESACREAESLGDDLSVCICLATEVAVRHYQGKFAEAEALAEQALRLADGSRDRQAHRFPISLFRGWSLMELDRIEEGQAVLQRGRRLVEELGG
jgi:tetratricopeptide (TPR) repeat protein